jgi:PAS domain S-box-containing protein
MHTAVIHDRGGTPVGYMEHFREMGQVRDIMDQQTELLTLYSKEKERIQTLINSIEDGVFTLGSDRRLRSFSPRLEELTGFPEKDVLGKDYTEILSVPSSVPSAPDLFPENLEEAAEIRDKRFEILTANGASIPALLNTIPLKGPDGEVLGLMGVVRDLRELEGLKRELEDRYSFANIIGTGPQMQEIFELTERLSDTNTNVLIQGESGTGKELVARALHYHSPRRDKPFMKINCSALPDPLLESELFGYEKGAFTGATRRKPGKFKLADGGTLFLDEIGETSAAFQAKLLRVVQDLEFEPLGGTSVEKVNVRILGATNKELKAEVAAGRFREDLYYRLCVVPIFLPPLRQRKEDIPLLIDHSLDKAIKKHPTRGGKKPVFTPQALSVMMDYDWPGNVRELENAVERAVVCSITQRIDVSVLPREIRDQALHPPPSRALLSSAEEDFDWEQAARIRDTLNECQGNKTLAAKMLGISRTTLWRKLREIEQARLSAH